jgi:SpoVK/Ycf46/Vps4 family AAA+-type ATPase
MIEKKEIKIEYFKEKLNSMNINFENEINNSISGLDDIKLKLKKYIEWPINFNSQFKRLGLSSPRGFFFFFF